MEKTIQELEQITTTTQQISAAFSKTCILVALTGFSCAATSWTAPNPYISTLALLLVSGVTIYALRRAFNFADKNPYKTNGPCNEPCKYNDGST